MALGWGIRRFHTSIDMFSNSSESIVNTLIACVLARMSCLPRVLAAGAYTARIILIIYTCGQATKNRNRTEKKTSFTFFGEF